MNKKMLFSLWGGLFGLCAALGFLPEPEGALRWLLTAAALACFLPPAVLLYRAKQEGDRHTRLLIRNLSAASLGLTLLLLVANFLGAFGSEFLGTALYYALVVVSSPMVCSGYWALSLFCWACLLVASVKKN